MRMVTMLQKEGIRIDGIGIQGHWGLNYFILNNLSLAGAIGGELALNSPKDLDNSTELSSFTYAIKIRFFF